MYSIISSFKVQNIKGFFLYLEFHSLKISLPIQTLETEHQYINRINIDIITGFVITIDKGDIDLIYI